MGKRSPLTSKEAEIIAGKLAENCDVKLDGAHKHALVRHKGKVIGKVGWRHDKTAGCGHIPRDLRVGPHFVLEMARCQHDYEAYIKELVKKKILTDEDVKDGPPKKP